MKEDSEKICRIKCYTCGRLLGTYIYDYNNGYFLPGLLDDDATNMYVGATSQIYVNGKPRKIYCTDHQMKEILVRNACLTCKPGISSAISIEEGGIINTDTKLIKKDIIDITEQAYENMCAKYPDKRDRYLEAKEIAISIISCHLFEEAK